jgi:hypothetical protein
VVAILATVLTGCGGAKTATNPVASSPASSVDKEKTVTACGMVTDAFDAAQADFDKFEKVGATAKSQDDFIGADDTDWAGITQWYVYLLKDLDPGVDRAVREDWPAARLAAETFDKAYEDRTSAYSVAELLAKERALRASLTKLRAACSPYPPPWRKR